MEYKEEPNSLEYEKSVLGSILVNPALLKNISNILPSNGFYNPDYQKIYAECVRLFDCYGPIGVDPVKIMEHIGPECHENIHIVINDLMANSGTSPNPEGLVNELLDYLYLRDVINYCDILKGKAYKSKSNIGSLCTFADKIQQKTDDFINKRQVKGRAKGKIVRVNDVSEDLLSYYDNGVKEIGLKFSRWPIFSQYFRLVKPSLNVINGIPSHGKSTLTDEFITSSIIDHKWKWAIFAPENMPHYLKLKDVVQKLMGVSMFGENNRITRKQLELAISHLQEHIFFIEPDIQRVVRR